MFSAIFNRVPAAVRAVALIALAAQAALGGVALLHAAWRDRSHGVAERLAGGVEERLTRSLGDDAAISLCLAAHAAPGEWALVHFDPAVAFGAAGEKRAARLTRLRHATFPRPFLVAAGAQPIAVAESTVPIGGSALLLALDADPQPTDRRGWIRLAGDRGFAIWRLQRS